MKAITPFVLFLCSFTAALEQHYEEKPSWSPLAAETTSAITGTSIDLYVDDLQQGLKQGMFYYDGEQMYKVKVERRAMQWRCTDKDWSACAVNPWRYKQPKQWVLKFVFYVQTPEDDEIEEYCYGDFVDADGTPVYLIQDVADSMNTQTSKTDWKSSYLQEWVARGAHVSIALPNGNSKRSHLDDKMNLVFTDETWLHRRIFIDSPILRRR